MSLAQIHSLVNRARERSVLAPDHGTDDDFVSGRAFQRERVFRDRNEVLETLSDRELIARYRFPRRSILELTDFVREDIERPTSRSHAIPAHIQVLTTLRIFAKGDYLSEVGDLHGISISSASRSLHSVCDALCHRLDNIKFPTAEAEILQAKEGFFRIAGFPNVIGAIDGTLIPIQGMSGDDEPAFISRKGFHAINVQAVVNASLIFMNIVVKWPGSTHDAFILNNSNVPEVMNGLNGWLLGDSGYPLKKWLMTPIISPNNPQEQRYNRAHCQTRNTVERSFGVLKGRFRCLHKTGGSLQFNPPKSVKIIETCFRLHNKALKDNIPLYDDIPVQLIQRNDIVVNNIDNEACRIRRQLVHRF